MKILITGVTGQLGYDVTREAERRGHEVVGVGRADDAHCRTYFKCDITKEKEVQHLMKICKPDVVIHCAAYTDVDAAEDVDEIELLAINYNAPAHFARCCQEQGSKMIYISTDYVFEDKFDTPALPRKTTEKPYTDQEYGWSKLQGEGVVKHLLRDGGNWMIVRISWVFGINGKNFVNKMLQLAETQDEVNVVFDQIGRPTYTVDLARLLIDMAESDKTGIYHATNEGDYISWFEFAKKIYALSGKNKITVKPVTTEDFGYIAKRPKNSMLDTSKLRESGFEPLPRWEDALARYLIEIGEINEVRS